ncbi:MAG: hypothetical protein J3Q66DRAFT_200345 [Benniella sp.]|nr:MAG: hypothetical protein J3Q66DRAFT_200345 [Benniella sp.]
MAIWVLTTHRLPWALAWLLCTRPPNSILKHGGWCNGKESDFTLSCSQIQKFKGAICKNTVDSAGLTTIQSVMEALIADARPMVLPGELPQGPTPPNQLRVRESAQAILADLWMIGQRFKSVSQSHVEAARLIATKITPKGLDHQTVKLTLVPPNRRSTLINTEAPSASSVVDSGESSGDGWGRNKNLRGGGNVGGGIGRGGRGGRFDNNRGRGGIGPAGRGRGGSGGFRGGHMNSAGQGSNVGGANSGSDDVNFTAFDPSTAGPTGDIMVSMTGKTQPVPYLATQPPTREELEESEQEYLAQLGDDGCLLKAYWGPRGAQGSSIATVLNSVTSLDSPGSSFMNPHSAPGSMGPSRDPLTAVAMAAQQKMKKLATKRPRLQDFAGRTPVAENGGHRP